MNRRTHFKKAWLALVLVFCMVTGLAGNLGVVQAAKVKKPSKPVITVTAKTGGFTVSIAKTKRASGYRVYYAKKGASYKSKKISKKGTAVRKLTVSGLDAGTYRVYAKAYRKVKGKTYWGAASKKVTVKVKKKSTANNSTNGGGYWKLTRVTPYGMTGNINSGYYYIEGTKSHASQGGYKYDMNISETGGKGQFVKTEAYDFYNMGKQYTGGGTGTGTFTFPKTAYAPKAEAVFNLTNKATEWGGGKMFSDPSIDVDFWQGEHTKDNIGYTRGYRTYDSDNNYHLEAAANEAKSGRFKGTLPDAPSDLTDPKQTIINIRVNYSDMCVVYRYVWTKGPMPSKVGPASGYITDGGVG